MKRISLNLLILSELKRVLKNKLRNISFFYYYKMPISQTISDKLPLKQINKYIENFNRFLADEPVLRIK